MRTYEINVPTAVGTHLFRAVCANRATADVALEVIIAGLRATGRADGREVTLTEWAPAVGNCRGEVKVLPLDWRL